MSKEGARFQLSLPPDCNEKLEELARVLSISRTAVIRQAIVRWHHEEPLVNSNGNGRAEVRHQPRDPATERR